MKHDASAPGRGNGWMAAVASTAPGKTPPEPEVLPPERPDHPPIVQPEEPPSRKPREPDVAPVTEPPTKEPPEPEVEPGRSPPHPEEKPSDTLTTVCD